MIYKTNNPSPGGGSRDPASSPAGPAEQVDPRVVQDPKPQRVPSSAQPQAARSAPALRQKDAKTSCKVSFTISTLSFFGGILELPKPVDIIKKTRCNILAFVSFNLLFQNMRDYLFT